MTLSALVVLIPFVLVVSVKAATSTPACDVLVAEQLRVEGQLSRLALQNPGTVASLAVCGGMVEKEPPSSAGQTFLTCAGSVCLFIGFDQCMSVGRQILAIMFESSRIDQERSRHGCH